MDRDPGLILARDQLMQPPVKLVPAPRVAETADDATVRKLMRRSRRSFSLFPERQARMLVIIPAHDEEDGIIDTLQEIVNQSRRPDKVVVVADNCTDATEDLVRDFMRQHPVVELMSTIHNRERKVGALNQAWLAYSSGYDLVACIDADTVLWKDVLAELEEELVPRTRCAGVMAKYTFDQDWVPPFLRYSKEPGRGKKQVENTRMPWLVRQLVRAQRLEFTSWNLDQLRRGRRTYVLGGQATLFRQEALLKAAYYNNGYGPWNADTDVEDMELTWRFQLLQLETLVSRTARAYAGAMYTRKSLWAQRRKWDEGMARLLLKYKLRKNTIYPWMRQIKMAFDLAVRLMFVLMFTISISLHSYVWSWVWLLPPLLSILLNLKVAQKMPKHTWRDFVFALLYFPAEIYLWFRLAVFTASWVSAVMGSQKDNWAGQKAAEHGAGGGGAAGAMILGSLLLTLIGMIIGISVMPRPLADETVKLGWTILQALTVGLSIQMGLKLLYMILRDNRVQA